MKEHLKNGHLTNLERVQLNKGLGKLETLYGEGDEGDDGEGWGGGFGHFPKKKKKNTFILEFIVFWRLFKLAETTLNFEVPFHVGNHLV